MSNTPLVSVIVPIYNVERYIDKCIKSVLSQTHKNIELILVNDGSPDGAGDICDIHAKSDVRVKVIHKENGGVSSARNAGLDIARGDFIVFIDGDDWVARDHVEYLLLLCQKENTSMSMSYGIYGKDKMNKDDRVDSQKVVAGVEIAADLLYHKTVIGSYNKMFARSLVYDNKVRFKENLFIGEGFNFIVMCAQLSKFVATGTKKTYYYRLDNTESAMTKFNIEKIRNNDVALDTIKKDFTIQSKKLDIAWNYARWITSLSFSVWMKSAKSQKRYKDEYSKMLHDIRFRAPWVIIANIALSKKISAILAIISPSFIVYILELKKKVKVK